jgi:hypothetical protein
MSVLSLGEHFDRGFSKLDTRGSQEMPSLWGRDELEAVRGSHRCFLRLHAESQMVVHATPVNGRHSSFDLGMSILLKATLSHAPGVGNVQWYLNHQPSSYLYLYCVHQ